MASWPVKTFTLITYDVSIMNCSPHGYVLASILSTLIESIMLALDCTAHLNYHNIVGDWHSRTIG